MTKYPGVIRVQITDGETIATRTVRALPYRSTEDIIPAETWGALDYANLSRAYIERNFPEYRAVSDIRHGRGEAVVIIERP